MMIKTKSQSEIIKTTLSILIVLCAFIIVWIVVNNFINSKDNFTIEKEVCVNESIIVDFIPLDYKAHMGVTFYSPVYKIEEVCTYEDVDEIEMPLFPDSNLISQGGDYCQKTRNQHYKDNVKAAEWNCSEKYGKNFENNCCSFTLIYYKKDLKIEWLNDNCECFTYCTDSDNCGGLFKVNGESCWKYSCQLGENKYIVSVK